MYKKKNLLFKMIFTNILLYFTFSLGYVTFTVDHVNAAEVSLKNTIESTLGYHHQLKSIQENRQAIIHDVQRAKAGWFPSVDVTANTGIGHSKDPGRRARYDTFSTSDGYDASAAEITLSQPLWDGLSTYHRVKAAEIQNESIDSRVVDTATALALDALIAHADVLLKRELLEYADKNVLQHEDILDDQKTLTESGASTVANVHQIQGRLSRARAQFVDAQGDLLVAKEAYLRITGITAPQALQSIGMPKTIFQDAQACFEVAQQFNPKILAYDSDSERALQLKKLTIAAYQPHLNAEFSAGAEHKGDDYADAMLVVRWNLFNGGADVASERIADAEYREARQEAFNIADTIKQETYDAWTDYTSYLEQTKLYAEAMDFNKQTKDGFMAQFLIGERGLLDVLDSYSELYNSSTQWATMRTNTSISTYTMSALAGHLLMEFEIENIDVLRLPL